MHILLIILFTNWSYTKMARQEILHTVLNNVCQRYSKLNLLSFSRHGTEKTISGVHVFPGSAETLVRQGGIANNHTISVLSQ